MQLETCEKVLDVTDTSALVGFRLSEVIEAFERLWRVKPTAIVLPLFGFSGPTFVNSVGQAVDSFHVGPRAHRRELALDDIVAEAVGAGYDVFLSLDCGLPFVNVGSINLVDIVGDSSPTACRWNPSARGILKLLVGDALKQVQTRLGDQVAKLRGLAIDMVDFWPMSATGERMELTCFCPACRRYLGAHGVDLKELETFPNAWNLVLQDSGTGISFIDSIDPEMEVQDLLRLSRLKGFVDSIQQKHQGIREKQLVGWAESLLKYVRARDRQTAEIVADIFGAARQVIPDCQRVLIAEGVQYNWTAGSFFRNLDSTEVCDELWYDPSSQQLVTNEVTAKYYMWRRSRYAIDAFFSAWHQASNAFNRNYTALGRVPEVRTLLQDRSRKALVGALAGPLAFHALPDSDRATGFVFPALSEETVKRMMDDLEEPIP